MDSLKVKEILEIIGIEGRIHPIKLVYGYRLQDSRGYTFGKVYGKDELRQATDDANRLNALIEGSDKV